MAKRSRKKVAERKDFQKVKFKVGKKKPKGQNVTDTAFQSKSITVLHQFQTSTAEFTSVRGLGFQEICSLLSHHTTSQRTFALNELNDFISRHATLIPDHIGDLLNALLPRLIDEDGRIRTRTNSTLSAIFKTLGARARNLLEPFTALVINYVICALTHINAATASDGLEVVDLLVEYVPLGATTEETVKLLTALLSMICSTTSRARAQNSVQLLSVGQFAKNQVRVLVLIRMLFIVEILCEPEAARKATQKPVMWDVSRPSMFALTGSLMIDLVPHPVILAIEPQRSPSFPELGRTISPQEKLVAVLLRVLSLVIVYWPSVVSSDDAENQETHKEALTCEELSGRRCCQDILKSVIGFVHRLYTNDDLRNIDTSSTRIFDAIKTLTVVNPLPPKSAPRLNWFRQVPRFFARMFPPYIANHSGEIAINRLNENMLELLKLYLTFAGDIGGSVELIRKIMHETLKLETFLNRKD